MQIFVTGATGSIGGPVIEELIRSGHQVMALARSNAAAQKLSKKGVWVVRGDLREPQDWCVEAATADVVVHAAATFSPDMTI